MELSADVMFVNKLPFVVTVSCHLNFCTAHLICSSGVNNLLESIKKVFTFYRASNFVITDLYMDHDFKPLRDHFKEDEVTARAAKHDGTR